VRLKAKNNFIEQQIYKHPRLSSFMKFTFNIEKRYAWAIIGLLVVITGGILINAYGGNTPSVMGHTLEEVEGWEQLATKAYVQEYVDLRISEIGGDGSCPSGYVHLYRDKTALCVQKGRYEVNATGNYCQYIVDVQNDLNFTQGVTLNTYLRAFWGGGRDCGWISQGDSIERYCQPTSPDNNYRCVGYFNGYEIGVDFQYVYWNYPASYGWPPTQAEGLYNWV